MSRLSKAIRKIRLNSIVTSLVVLAEKLLGSGTGEIKKKLVSDIVAAIVRRAKEAGKDVPENYQELVDELIEQAVAIFNHIGWLQDGADLDPDDEPTPAPAKRGRPVGSSNKAKTAEPTESTADLSDEDVALLESLEG